jgi:hypothetical protein
MKRLIMVEVLYFEVVEKRNPRSALWVSRGRLRGFREVPRTDSLNQRNVTEGSPASAATVSSQQGRQTCPTVA